MAEPTEYSVQEQIQKHVASGFWDNIERIGNLSDAISKAQALNADFEPGQAIHRVVNIADGREMYRRGWIL